MTAEDHEWLTAIQSDYEVGAEQWRAIQSVLDREPLVQEVIRLSQRKFKTLFEVDAARPELLAAIRKLAEWKP